MVISTEIIKDVCIQGLHIPNQLCQHGDMYRDYQVCMYGGVHNNYQLHIPAPRLQPLPPPPCGGHLTLHPPLRLPQWEGWKGAREGGKKGGRRGGSEGVNARAGARPSTPRSWSLLTVDGSLHCKSRRAGRALRRRSARSSGTPRLQPTHRATRGARGQAVEIGGSERGSQAQAPSPPFSHHHHARALRAEATQLCL